MKIFYLFFLFTIIHAQNEEHMIMIKDKTCYIPSTHYLYGIKIPNNPDLEKECETVITCSDKIERGSGNFENMKRIYLYESYLEKYALAGAPLEEVYLYTTTFSVSSFAGDVNKGKEKCLEPNKIKKFVEYENNNKYISEFFCAEVENRMSDKTLKGKTITAKESGSSLIFSGFGTMKVNDTQQYKDQIYSEIVIENGINRIFSNVFNGFTVSSIRLPNTLYHIGSEIFNNNTRLQSLVFPPMISQLMLNELNNCTSLKSITIQYVGDLFLFISSTSFSVKTDDVP